MKRRTFLRTTTAAGTLSLTGLGRAAEEKRPAGAAGRGIWGIDDTDEGQLVWRPFLPPGTTQAAVPYWHGGHCWSFGYENGRWWVDPGQGSGTVRFVRDGRERVVTASGKRVVLE